MKALMKMISRKLRKRGECSITNSQRYLMYRIRLERQKAKL